MENHGKLLSWNYQRKNICHRVKFRFVGMRAYPFISQLDVLSSHEIPGSLAIVFPECFIEIAGVAVAQHG